MKLATVVLLFSVLIIIAIVISGNPPKHLIENGESEDSGGWAPGSDRNGATRLEIPQVTFDHWRISCNPQNMTIKHLTSGAELAITADGQMRNSQGVPETQVKANDFFNMRDWIFRSKSDMLALMNRGSAHSILFFYDPAAGVGFGTVPATPASAAFQNFYNYDTIAFTGTGWSVYVTENTAQFRTPLGNVLVVNSGGGEWRAAGQLPAVNANIETTQTPRPVARTTTLRPDVSVAGQSLQPPAGMKAVPRPPAPAPTPGVAVPPETPVWSTLPRSWCYEILLVKRDAQGNAFCEANAPNTGCNFRPRSENRMPSNPRWWPIRPSDIRGSDWGALAWLDLNGDKCEPHCPLRSKSQLIYDGQGGGCNDLM